MPLTTAAQILKPERIETRNFTGTSSTTTGIRGKQVDVMISGTFVATLDIQTQDADGNWITMESVTAPAIRVFEPGNARRVRVICSAFTSGTVVTRVEAGSP